MDCRCPDCPPSTTTQNAWNSWDQDPHNAYNNAFYHYQAYTYYWNLHNAHFGHARESSFCECYDNERQGHDGFSHFSTRNIHRIPMRIPSSRCQHCPDEDFSQFTGDLDPRETQSYFQDDSSAMEFDEEKYDDDDDDDDDEQNFEVDEGFCQFLKQSEKHRKEREKGTFLINKYNK
jgi:hypothetical protein